jgi:hypothetical protein
MQHLPPNHRGRVRRGRRPLFAVRAAESAGESGAATGRNAPQPKIESAELRGDTTGCDASRNERRMGWDSNPRMPFDINGFQDRRLQPLGHPSGIEVEVRVKIPSRKPRPVIPRRMTGPVRLPTSNSDRRLRPLTRFPEPLNSSRRFRDLSNGRFPPAARIPCCSTIAGDPRFAPRRSGRGIITR